MIGAVVHIGVTVSDMDRSIGFYRDVLGLRFCGELVMEGEEADRLFGKKDCRVRVAYLNGSDSVDAPPVELIQFVRPVARPDTASLMKTSISEICFEARDIDGVCARLQAAGVDCLSAPQPFDFTSSGFGRSKAVYFRDPDGIILELMEPLP